MKILISIPAFLKGKGGAEKIASLLANHFSQSGHEILLFCTERGNNQQSYHLNSSIEVFPCQYLTLNDEPAYKKIINFAPQIIIFFYADVSLLKQYIFFKQFHIPLIAQECSNPNRVVRNLHKALSDLMTIQGTFLLRQAILNKLNAVRFTQPEYTKSILLTGQCKVFGFKNGFPQLTEQLEHITKEKKIICVGGLKTFNKNGFILALAFREIAQEFPDWSLHFYGEASYYAKKLQYFFKCYRGISNKIHIRGLVNDMHAEYCSAEIHVVCSYDEGNPNSVNEAMCAGVPTIGFADCPGVFHNIKHNQNGLLIDREQEKENLIKALRLLISKEPFRRELGANAFHQAKQQLEISTFYKNWENLIEEVI